MRRPCRIVPRLAVLATLVMPSGGLQKGCGQEACKWHGMRLCECGVRVLFFQQAACCGCGMGKGAVGLLLPLLSHAITSLLLLDPAHVSPLITRQLQN